MRIQTMVISEPNEDFLQEKLNELLTELKADDVIDIKFSVTDVPDVEGNGKEFDYAQNRQQFSALIIFKDHDFITK